MFGLEATPQALAIGVTVAFVLGFVVHALIVYLEPPQSADLMCGHCLLPVARVVFVGGRSVVLDHLKPTTSGWYERVAGKRRLGPMTPPHLEDEAEA